MTSSFCFVIVGIITIAGKTIFPILYQQSWRLQITLISCAVLGFLFALKYIDSVKKERQIDNRSKMIESGLAVFALARRAGNIEVQYKALDLLERQGVSMRHIRAQLDEETFAGKDRDRVRSISEKSFVKH